MNLNKLVLLTFAFVAIVACKKDSDDSGFTFVDGTYKASEADFAHGWKGYLQIVIKADSLNTVEFDYMDSDGDKKSETTEAEYPMNPHPSIWLPQYETNLTNTDIVNFTDVDAISGATNSGETVNTMMKTLLEAAKNGDESEQIINE